MTAMGNAWAQQLLGLEEAISLALANNYSIKIEAYNVQVSQNNVSRSVAGQMPRLEVSGGYEWGYSSAEIQTRGTADGTNPPLELDGTSSDINVKTEVTVPIFQGFKGKYTYERLENSHALSELQMQSVIELTVAQTVSTYLQVARHQARLGLKIDNIGISYDRWQRVQTDARFGTANSVRVLQAQVDLNTDSAEYRTTQLEYENAKRDLNLLMVRDEDIAYEVNEQLNLIDQLDYETLLTEMKANNAQLSISRRSVENAMLESKISKSTYMPIIQGYANLSYLDSEDEASFIQSNQVLGPNVGVQMSFPVFTGGLNKIQRQNTRLQLQQQELSLAQTELVLTRDLRNAFARYQNHQQQLRIEQQNLPTFERNFDKISADYALGLVDAADLRTAQVNLALARNRINNLEYDVKQSEITLLQLSGRLGTE